MEISLNKTIKICCVYVFAIIVLISVNAFAAEPPSGPVKRMSLTITHKNADSFYVQERKYLVNKKTVILDYDNKKISFKQLWVPCKANVEFRTVNGNESLCMKIKVKSSLRGETNNPEMQE